MELILWRHADAGEPSDDPEQDLARRLSPRGRKQSARMAAWLAARLPERYGLVSSPAPRAVETAEALRAKVRLDPILLPGARGEDVLKAVAWPSGQEGRPRHCVLVGHQPTLGRAAALALTGVELDWAMKKAALIWLTARPDDPERPILLRAVIGPDLL